MSAPRVQLTDGGAVTGDHLEIKPNGQQKDYVVLAPEERAKGFVRPYRDSYVHVGPRGPEHPLRDITDEERERYASAPYWYVKYEEYPENDSSAAGKFWTQAELDSIGKGCGTLTKMSRVIAETYARDPSFYGGTFCMGCGKHLPLVEFVWDGTDQLVGS